jgi:hypothetical protein
MAPLAYATLGGVKQRMGIDDTVDDALLTIIIADVNQDIEDMAGRQVGPGTVTDELIDGHDAIEDGRCLLYPRGLRTVTKLEMADERGGTFTDVTSDVMLRPLAYLRQPDWPAMEMWLDDDAAIPIFLPGYENVRLTAAIGWAAIPSTLTAAAETTALRTFLSNRGGYPEGSDDTGIRNYRALWRDVDIQTVHRFAYKVVEII